MSDAWIRDVAEDPGPSVPPGSSAARIRTSIPALSRPARARLKKELVMIKQDPPPGIAAFVESDADLSRWRAEISGPPNSPFQDGIFDVQIQFLPRYPMQPPSCRFVCTPAPYHPNIDSQGRICLDTLKSPPTGSWTPAVSLPSLLLTFRALLAMPNPDDGLEPEISRLYREHPDQWRAEAAKRTQQLMVLRNENLEGSPKRQGDASDEATAKISQAHQKKPRREET